MEHLSMREGLVRPGKRVDQQSLNLVMLYNLVLMSKVLPKVQEGFVSN